MNRNDDVWIEMMTYESPFKLSTGHSHRGKRASQRTVPTFAVHYLYYDVYTKLGSLVVAGRLTPPDCLSSAISVSAMN
jgi:hypothetical protein